MKQIYQKMKKIKMFSMLNDDNMNVNTIKEWTKISRRKREVWAYIHNRMVFGGPDNKRQPTTKKKNCRKENTKLNEMVRVDPDPTIIDQ